MAVKFFGQFLLEKSVVTREQLLDAVAYQESKNLKLGDYAVAKGYLSAAQLSLINEEQKRTDMRIGELAVSMGILSQTRLDELLMMQKNDHVMIGEAFVRRGILSPDVVERELVSFREDQKPYATDRVPLPEGLEGADLALTALDLTIKMFQRVAHIEAKTGKRPGGENPASDCFCMVTVKMTGEMKADYVLCMTRLAAIRIAASFIGADSDSDVELKDGAREFCNIICGNVMAMMARKGKHVEISPPLESPVETDVIMGRRAAVYPLVTASMGTQILMIIDA